MQNLKSSTPLVRTTLIEKIARRCGWLRRSNTSTGLTPAIFVQALLASIAAGRWSFRELALEAGLLTGKTISKQGFSKRANASAVELLKQLAGEALRRAAVAAPGLAGKIPGVVRILVGDSSTLTLHPSLAGHFPGATNQTDKVSAQLRLQLTFDLVEGSWLQASPDPYNRNDRSAANDILDVLRPGDLTIRDLGYATIASFRAIAARDAYFLSRLSPSVSVLEPDGDPIDILALARAHATRPGDTYTAEVMLGKKERLACRLVIIRAPEDVANQRRRHLNEDSRRRGGKTHTKPYLALQGLDDPRDQPQRVPGLPAPPV